MHVLFPIHVIAPDGCELAFSSEHEGACSWYDSDAPGSLWIMNRDGTDLHRLRDDADSPAWGRTPSIPAPTITGLNPASAAVGGPAFTLTVNGTNFVSGSVVRRNGNVRARPRISTIPG